MATTALWRITKHALSDVVEYVENPEKTVDVLGTVLEYAGNGDKTEEFSERDGDARKYVSGVNCPTGAAATKAMLAVKKRFGKEDGTIAYHGYQSFKGWETTPETAHEIGVKLAEQLWGSRYQVLVATHLDHESHLHNHFVINTVSFVDGKKFYRSNADYAEMRRASDELCREYGLSVIEQPKGRTPDRLSDRCRMARAAVDEAIENTSSMRDFAEYLARMGYTVDLDPKHKHWTITREEWGQSIRMDERLGDAYTNENLLTRITGYSDAVNDWYESKLSERAKKARAAVDEAIVRSSTLREFADCLLRMGYTVDLNPNHKYWTIIGEGWGKNIRMYRFGSEYTNDRLLARLSEKTGEKVDRSTAQGSSYDRPRQKRVRCRVGGSIKRSRRAVGFSRLYYHYCYLLGVFPRNNPRQHKRYSYVLYEDLKKLDMITDETMLLAKHHIETAEQLVSYRDSVKSRIEKVTERRRELYNAARTVSVKSDKDRSQKIKDELADISRELSRLRREVQLCDDISSRSALVREKIRVIREDEKNALREHRQNENLRGKDEQNR